MPLPLPVVIITALAVVGLAVAVVVVGWRAKAIGPGVFVLLGGALLILAALAMLWGRR
jgi:hypothetical protein